jgi:hypothetical protein
MRIVAIAAGLAACLGLAACDQSKSQATETQPPAAPKSLSRPAPLYAGQEQILEVDSASIAPAKAADTLTLKAAGKTPSAGYYDLAFVPRINAAPPPDGIYDVDIVGYKPQAAAAQAATPVETKGEWQGYPKERLKGVRFMAKNNAVVVMLPKG